MTNLKLELDKRVIEGLIRTQTDGELTIYNYTEECQFGKKWDEYSLMARGLILDSEGNIIARPFDKFFNSDEAITPFTDPISLEEVFLIHGKPRIEEKMDGSLGIIFNYKGKVRVATRGSFQSDQAIEAMKMLSSKNLEERLFPEGWTYLFEIIYPENRIVIDYHGKRDLIYLATRENSTGDYVQDPHLGWMFPVPEVYNSMVSSIPNKEGYVLVFPDGFRVKVKFEEYVRLHRIMTGLTDKAIWESLRAGDEINLTGVPEEFSKIVKEKVDFFKHRFKIIKERAIKAYDLLLEHSYPVIDDWRTTDKLDKNSRQIRSNFAKRAVDTANPGLMFMLYDGKNIDDAIWKLIKPKIEEEV